MFKYLAEIVVHGDTDRRTHGWVFVQIDIVCVMLRSRHAFQFLSEANSSEPQSVLKACLMVLQVCLMVLEHEMLVLKVDCHSIGTEKN